MGEPVKTETKPGSVTSLKKPGGTPQYFNPFTDFDRLFDEFLPRSFFRPLRSELANWPNVSQLEAKLPRVDVVDRDGEIAVRAELPGVDKKDLDITVAENTVTIKGSTSTEEKEEKGDYYRCEISRGSFARTVALPAAVNAEAAKAKFTNGILELTLPKVERAARRTIRVE